MLRATLFANLRHLKLTRSIQTKTVKQLLETTETQPNEQEVRVVGWIRGYRDQKNIKFANLIDGSDARHLQLVFLDDKFHSLDPLQFNMAVECQGLLVKSGHKKQNFELRVTDMNVINPCDPASYPFKARAKYTLEQLRPHTHLRTHSAVFSDLMRMRSQLTWNIHEYFRERGFTHIHTPVITSNNCEGGCETFQVRPTN